MLFQFYFLTLIPFFSSHPRNPGTFHTAVLQGLQPLQTIYYVFGDAQFGFSSEFVFTHTPPPGGDVQFVAFGDLGQQTIDDTQEQVWLTFFTHTLTSVIHSFLSSIIVLNVCGVCINSTPKNYSIFLHTQSHITRTKTSSDDVYKFWMLSTQIHNIAI